MEVANGCRYYNPPKFPLLLESDLGVLPMYFSNTNDYLLVDNLPEIDNFLKNFYNTKFILKNNIDKIADKQFDKFLPWGISPRAFNFINKIKKNFSNDFLQSPIGNYSEEKHKKLFSRDLSSEVLKKFISQYGNSFFPTLDQLPQKLFDTRSALELFNIKFDTGNGVVFKAPMSSSGRGIQMFRKREIDDNFKKWLKYIFRTQGFVMCETLFDKKDDFSLHFKIENSIPKFIGVSIFKTSNNGFYIGSVAKKFNNIPDFSVEFTLNLVENIKKVLCESNFCKNYSGFLGIDGITYYESGNIKINPFVEINCRHSMGLLAMMLEKFSLLENPASFLIIQQSDFQKYIPMTADISTDGKILSGFLQLSDKKSKYFKAGLYVE